MLPKLQMVKRINRPAKPERLQHTRLSKCEQHGFVVSQPNMTLCSEFTSDQDGVSTALLESSVSPAQVYAWIWLQYRFVEASDNVHTVNQLLPLATLKGYAEMTPTERNHRILRLRNAMLHELQAQLAPKTIVSEEMYRKNPRVRRENSFKRARGMLKGIDTTVDREDDRE